LKSQQQFEFYFWYSEEHGVPAFVDGAVIRGNRIRFPHELAKSVIVKGSFFVLFKSCRCGEDVLNFFRVDL
jgi:hypothetical protein